MSTNKNILRGLLVLSYIIIIALVIYGIASVFSYLNTGADRSKILHLDVKQTAQYLPECHWAPLANEGRAMDKQTLSEIEDNYLDAWFVRHIAYKTNTTHGIDDYYTKNARKNIYDIVAINIDNATTIEATTLAHNPTLEFFSEDGQLAVITDKDVIEYKRILKNGNVVTEVNEKSTYKVTLLLEDGFWRIRHLVRIKSEPYVSEVKNRIASTSHIKGINYYPQATPWDMFGANFNPEVIAKDFKIIQDAGLNSIRIFIPYEDFGKALVKPEKINTLIQVLDLAKAHNLEVLVTLFDFYGDYSVLDWSLTQQHAIAIVNSIKHHSALLAWDIKNEPNLDFKSRGKMLVNAWLSKMIAVVKSQDVHHPVTIGWSDADSALILKDKLDFISFHYYDALENLAEIYNTLKSDSGNTPIVISEYGMSSYKGLWNPFGPSEDSQAEYHKSFQKIITEYDIPFISWTLYDFESIPDGVVGKLPWRKNAQKYFGFINKDGKNKPSFKFISPPKSIESN